MNKKSRKRQNLRAALVLLVLVALLALVAFLVTRGGAAPAGGTPAGQSEPAAPPPGPAFSLPASESALLPPAQDAGDDYLAGTLFIGDSNIRRMADNGLLREDQIMAEQGLTIGSIEGYQYVWYAAEERYQYVAEALARVLPKRVLISLGTNDVDILTVEQYIAAYESALDVIRAAVPDAVVIVNSIPPGASDYAELRLKASTVIGFNEALEAMCQRKGVYFLNSWEALAGENQYARPEYIESDGIHFNPEGLAAMLDYYRTHAPAQPQG